MFITACYKNFMEPKTPFGAALRYYRKKRKNLTQPRLSSDLGISQAMLSKLELGKLDGSSELRENIAEYFKVTYSDFIETGRRELAPPPPDRTEIRQVIKEEIKFLQENPPPYITNFLEAKNREHHETINKFKDQDTALKINSILVKIEAVDPLSLGEIEKMLQAKLISMEERVKKQTPDDGNKGERSGKRA